MKKVVFFLVLSVCFFTSKSQTIYPGTGTAKGTNRFLGTLIVDSTFVLSPADTILLGSYYNTTILPVRGTVRFKGSNNTYYYWNGAIWKEMGGGVSGSSDGSIVVTGSSGTSIANAALVNKTVTALIIANQPKNTGFTKSLGSNTISLTDGSALIGGETITIFIR